MLFRSSIISSLSFSTKKKHIGLVTEERYNRFVKKKADIEAEIERLKSVRITPKESREVMEELGVTNLNNGFSLYEFLKRPEINYSTLERLGKGSEVEISDEVKEQAVIMIKYEGYIEKQMRQIDQFRKLEKKKLSIEIDYNKIEGLDRKSVV